MLKKLKKNKIGYQYNEQPPKLIEMMRRCCHTPNVQKSLLLLGECKELPQFKDQAGCQFHKKYQAIMEPKVACRGCWAYYFAKYELKKDKKRINKNG